MVPKTVTSSSTAHGWFGRADFIYDVDKNKYRCPAGQRLIWRFETIDHGLKLHYYCSSHCKSCSMKAQCTPGTNRRVKRWENEGILDDMQNRLDHAHSSPDGVEHPFGTIKSWMGATHFLTRTLHRVGTEMSLHVFAYNLKRVMKLLGIGALMEAMMA
jgi:transposase